MDAPSYQQDVKQQSRERIWHNAITLLTAERDKTRIIPEEYMRHLWRYAEKEVIRPVLNLSLDQAACDDWCDFSSSSYGVKSAADLKIAYLSGPEPENDLRVLLSLGVRLSNVWAFENNASMYEAALVKARKNFPALKIYPGKIDNFVTTNPLRFDIIYLDFTGSLFSASSKTFRSLHSTLERHALNPLSVLIVNSSEPQESEDSKLLLASYFSHQLFVEGVVYGELDEEGVPITHCWKVQTRTGMKLNI